MKKLIIVCDNKTEEYANLLRQLISSKDDTENEVVGIEDGTVGVVVWLEKEYRDKDDIFSCKVCFKHTFPP